jgi:L-fuconolactonase
MSRLDSHVHLWDARRFAIDWLARAPRLARRYELADLDAEAGDDTPGQVVAVQAGTSPAGSRWLAHVASREPRIAGIVVSCRLGDGETWSDLERRLLMIGNPPGTSSLFGVRVAGRGKGADFFTYPMVRDGLELLADHGIAAHVLADGSQLAGLARTVRTSARPRVVLDHLGSPPKVEMGDGATQWRAGLVELAEVPGVVAKVSGVGLVTTARDWAERVVEHAAATFGTRRLMFGSDWPMTTPELPYSAVREVIGQLIARAGADGPLFWSGLARDFYRIPGNVSLNHTRSGSAGGIA